MTNVMMLPVSTLEGWIVFVFWTVTESHSCRPLDRPVCNGSWKRCRSVSCVSLDFSLKIGRLKPTLTGYMAVLLGQFLILPKHQADNGSKIL